MKVLVTGAKGFVGKNLVGQLKNIQKKKIQHFPIEIEEVYEYDVDSSPEDLELFCKEADFVFNLAGVNRPKDEREFMEGNFGFASTLLNTLKKHGNNCPVMISSSTQAALDNPYGESKRAGEELLREYGKETGAKVLIYRFPNLFGKWCRPNYNSAVATFCNNKANDLPIKVNNPATELTLLYVDDLIDEMLLALQGKEHHIEREDGEDFCEVPFTHKVTLGEIVEILDRFVKMPKSLGVPDLSPGGFEKKLYSTYLSYLPKEKMSYKLKMNKDDRGSFTEIIRTPDRGQISVNISKPGITKGQHWHHTKTEKFVVVKGRGLIQLRKEGSEEILNFPVNGEEITVVEMIPGYTHNIINLSDTEDLVTLMWCNEPFDPNRPDTYFDPV